MKAFFIDDNLHCIRNTKEIAANYLKGQPDLNYN